MEEPFVFEVEMDPGRLQTVRPAFEASLLHQNRAFRGRHKRVTDVLRKVGLVLALVGLGLIVLIAVIGPRPGDWGWVLGYGAAFAVIALIFFQSHRIEALFGFLPARGIAWRVGKTFRELEAKCPYRIDYVLDALGFTAKSDELGVDKRVSFEDYRFAIQTASFFHLYATPKTLSPKAIIYFDDEQQRSRIVSSMGAANIEIVELPKG